MRHLLLLSALIAGTTAPIYADTAFSLVDNTFTNGATASGTVNIDTTTGVFDSIDVTLLSGGTSYLFTGAPTSQSTYNNATQYYATYFDGNSDELVLDVPGASLRGYAGGNLCSTSNLCGSGYAGAYAIPNGVSPMAFPLATGSLSAVTPEPSSVVLLGTGILGALGAVRRRAGRVA